MASVHQQPNCSQVTEFCFSLTNSGEHTNRRKQRWNISLQNSSSLSPDKGRNPHICTIPTHTQACNLYCIILLLCNLSQSFTNFTIGCFFLRLIWTFLARIHHRAEEQILPLFLAATFCKSENHCLIFPQSSQVA